jgi:hypothetical protein
MESALGYLFLFISSEMMFSIKLYLNEHIKWSNVFIVHVIHKVIKFSFTKIICSLFRFLKTIQKYWKHDWKKLKRK